MPVKIAIVMTGHPRMVAYGNKLVQMVQQELPDAQLTIFSNVWNSDSDIRQEFITLSSADTSILNALKYHRVQNQTEFMDKIYRDYNIDADRKDFSNKAAQFLGMLDALSHWQTELEQYDYIIKSRWDQILDTITLSRLATEKLIGFFNKAIYLNKGNVEISGNTIYGDSESWFKHFMPVNKVMDIIKQYLDENKNVQWPAHGLLGYICQQTHATVIPMGEEWGIRSNLLKTPIDTLTKKQAIGLSCP